LNQGKRGKVGFSKKSIGVESRAWIPKLTGSDRTRRRKRRGRQRKLLSGKRREARIPTAPATAKDRKRAAKGCGWQGRGKREGSGIIGPHKEKGSSG